LLSFQKTTQSPEVLISEQISSASDNIKDSIYAHPTVKSLLKADQRNRCCYCEKPIEGSYNDVEHYRPKGRVREEEDHKGYWWLGYDWNNLLFACSVCNRSNKNDQFPIHPDSNRAFEPDDNIEDEDPLILNPTDANVEELFEYIYYTRLVSIGGDEIERDFVKIEAKRGTDELKAQTTITLLDLNREDLQEGRGGVYTAVETLLYNPAMREEYLSSSDEEKKRITTKLIDKFVLTTFPYSGLILFMIKTWSKKLTTV